MFTSGSSNDTEESGGRQGVISNNHLLNLCTLAYSDNVDLQRSAALCFSEFSEKCEPESGFHIKLVCRMTSLAYILGW